MWISRDSDLGRLKMLLSSFPATAILGARQTGKTSLARIVGADHYFDLENPADLRGFDNPMFILSDLEGLIVIDEIQRRPELFPVLRHLIDTKGNKQKYLILGSASRDLIAQSSESLAGRIAYYHLSGFTIDDVEPVNWKKLWLKGGFPRSYLADSNEQSHLWRENFISTFLERDIPSLGINIPARTLRRFWMMLSHYHGQTMNYSEFARAFGVSDMTIRSYIDILAGTYMVRILEPWHSNTSKRLVKSPKIYFSDSGLFHTLSSIDNEQQLNTHNKLGASFEGFALDQVCRALGKSDDSYFFWKTHAGAGVDLYFEHGGKQYGVEIKFADAPRLTKSMKIAVADLDLAHLWVVYPGEKSYALDEDITLIPIGQLNRIAQFFG